jgi:outer membrane protein OmpA-like peptidoglycan-associated protein
VYAFAGVGYEMVSGGHDKFDSLPFLQGGLGIAYGINKRIRILAEAKALQMMDGHGVSGDEENEFALFFGANILLNDIASPVPKRQFARRIVRKPARARTVVRVIEHLKKPTSTVPRPFKTIRSNRDGSVIDLGLQFSRKSAKFTADSKTKIKAFYRKFKRMPKGSIVTINAYTDNARSPRKSKNLSSKRAFALRKALIKLGARKRTVRAYGLGEKNPIADNNTPEGRVENERIELVILKKEKKK